MRWMCHYVYLSVILWYPTLQVIFVLFTVLNSGFFWLFHFPDIHSVSNPCNISVGPVFWEVFGFFGSKQYFLPAGGTVPNRPGLFQLQSPVKISL